MTDMNPCHSCEKMGVIEEVREDEIYYTCPACGHVENSAEYLAQSLILLEKTINEFYVLALGRIDDAEEKKMDAWVEKHRYRSSTPTTKEGIK